MSAIGLSVTVMMSAASMGTASAASGSPSPPFTECPAIGSSPSCEILLVVNPDETISVLGDSSVGPYDGGDDTLVGILNNSTVPISAITVSGPSSGLAAFDGDGICTYAIGGTNGSGFSGDSYCTSPQVSGTDPADYAGPGTSFTLDQNSQDDVEVDFAGSGLAAGSSTFFSLEGALTAAVVTAREGGIIPSATSAKWAGYVSQYPPNTPVSARVTLPKITCNTAGQMAMWVGYDGQESDSNTVEQDGVSAICPRANGSASFALWYELFKGSSWNPFPNIHQIAIPARVNLQPGDSVDLFVNLITPDRFRGIPLGRDKIYFSISAYNASGQSIMRNWTKIVTEPLFFSPKYNSSECIAEAPGTRAGLLPMPDFGTVTFTNCSAIDNIRSSSDLLRLDMVRNGNHLATTGSFARTGNGENYFPVSWVASK